jgi:hypothetical protein
METFTEPREFVEDLRYAQDRSDALAALDLSSIDRPIVDIVDGFAALPHCFTLQCCYGHFIRAPDQDHRSLDPIPRAYSGLLTYRIAYVAFCIENSRRGWGFRQALAGIPKVAPGCVQFGSADWFWERWVNSYALQVEPVAHQLEDEVILEAAEATCIQMARDLFFKELRALLASELREHVPGKQKPLRNGCWPPAVLAVCDPTDGAATERPK